MNTKSLYERIGGYEGISAAFDDLMNRIKKDPQLGRFYKFRGDHGAAREKQLTINMLAAAAGGPSFYPGRDMKTAHKGMGIDETDWAIFMDLWGQTAKALNIPDGESNEMIAFLGGLKGEIVE